MKIQRATPTWPTCIPSKSKLDAMWECKTEAARVRSRVKDFEEGEKSSKFFFSAEKIHGRNKLWHRIKDSNGVSMLGIDNILKIQATFFAGLFKSEGYDQEATTKLTSNVYVTLDPNEVEKCERLITSR